MGRVVGLLLVVILGLVAGWGVPWSQSLAPDAMKINEGLAYTQDVTVSWPWILVPDSQSRGDVSSLRLFEDGRALGPAHALHAAIRQEGGGRFSHWGSAVWFSSSDGSDPRVNGRDYRLTGTVRLDIRLEVAAMGLCLALALALGIRGGPGGRWVGLPWPLTEVAQGARRLYPVLWVYGLVVLVAYGLRMFNLVATEDDWDTLTVERYQIHWVISIGRWLITPIWQMAEDNSPVPALSVSALALGYLYIALACSWCLGLARQWSWLTFALVLVTFSYNAEPFLLSMQHLPFAVGMVLATSAGLLTIACEAAVAGGQRRGALGRAVAAVCMLAASMAIYQAMAMIFVAVILMRVLGRAAEAITVRAIVVLPGLALAVLVSGLGGYAVSVEVFAFFSGISPKSTGGYALWPSLSLSGGALSARIERAMTLLGDLVLAPHQLYPPGLVPVLAAIAVIAGGLYALGPIKGRQRGEVAGRLLVFMMGLGLLLVAPLTLGMLRDGINWRFNTLIALAVPHAAIVALLVERIGGRRVVVLVAGLVLVLVFQQNRATLGIMQLNQRDMAIVERMLGRITADPGFAAFVDREVVDVVFASNNLWPRGELASPGSPKDYGAARFMNAPLYDCGLFNCEVGLINFRAAVPLIAEGMPHYRFSRWPDLQVAIPEREREALSKRIQEAHPWPAPDWAIFSESVIVLVLKRP
ncbi:MAG: glucosyltransferase domain-containing protein [Magnetospirillum sp.]|nr:glucosyltransferase domain-containing protein [Magnetospirillum sp.]